MLRRSPTTLSVLFKHLLCPATASAAEAISSGLTAFTLPKTQFVTSSSQRALSFNGSCSIFSAFPLSSSIEFFSSMASVAEAPPAQAKALSAEERKHEFLAVYARLRDELVADPLLGTQPEFATSYTRRMLDFNVPGGKLNRGLAVADAVAAIVSPPPSTSTSSPSVADAVAALPEETRFKADALGWCIEWLQAFFLVADDIMDASLTRRGQPCWYKVDGVGMVACNDYIVLESCLYRILSMHFKGEPYYAALLDLFHETTHQTAYGQQLDVTVAPPGTVDLSRYTEDTYNQIVTYKTAYYSFYLPIACGMMVAGVVPGHEAYVHAREICLEMGRYFQIQDDVLDAFGDPAVIGKVGTDIQDNKCSWLVVQAMKKLSLSDSSSSEEKRKVLEENYGKHDESSVSRVKELYRELELERLFKEYEQASHEVLMSKVRSQDALPAGVFTAMLDKIYKRSK